MKNLIALALLLLYAPFYNNNTVITRFKAPAGYKMVGAQAGSFAAYLQSLPLKPAGTPTRTYQGNISRTDGNTAAVVDMSIGTQDLQQCADAVIRLRSEYLYKQKNYRALHFNFTSGFNCDFTHYADGYRYQNGRWVLKGKKDYSYASFMRYMNLVFAYAGTLSLEKELQPVSNAAELKIGDVFIRGGSPGHCFIVVNVAMGVNGKKLFMLAQSFMPAQNIQVLQHSGGPWFSIDKQPDIPYGELINKAYLKRF